MPSIKSNFDVKRFLANIGHGRKIVRVPKKDRIYAQGDACDAIFYIKKGKIKLTVVSKEGKEATIAILNSSDFFGEGCLAAQPLRMGSATAMTDCELMRIENTAMQSALHRENKLSDMFVAYLLGETSGTKRIWLINSSTPAKNAWLGYFCCWPVSERRGSRKR